MSTTKRLNTAIDAALAERLDRESIHSVPKLTKRYVVELALRRLFLDIDRGQYDLQLPRKDLD